ncbi:MAG: M20/M25/M40 family metallo-hydrolase [Gemmatimonadota bacterium]
MRRAAPTLALALAATVLPGRATGQTFYSDDPVLRAIWTEGMEKSQLYPLAQVLLDSIGPRLTGSPGFLAGGDWLLRTYQRWGIAARKEEYGTWGSWRRGVTHIDLLAPRVRTLEGTLLAWSPGTEGPMEGDAIMLPDLADSAALDDWLPMAKGMFVLVSLPESTCRADQEWEEYATPESFERMKAARDSARRDYLARLRSIGFRGLHDRIARAGAAAIVTARWSGGWGVNKVQAAETREAPTIDLSCEDYGLVYRLAERGQGPRIRLNADAEFLGVVPAFNVIAELPGTEKPEEYVVLSAHFDSWDSASGATDNGTGTLTMLEAMRILARTYPRPKRTVLVGHWGGEEQGLIGSTAFAEDHPEVVEGLQVAFNQDNGTWRIEYIKMQGFSKAGANLARWITQVPDEIKRHIELDLPGLPDHGGSDHKSFVCHGAPGFRLQSSYPEYRQYTWHTNRDTFDKIVFDDLRNNATLAAMLAYLASEDSERVPRDRIVLPADEQGRPMSWPRCSAPRRIPG